MQIENHVIRNDVIMMSLPKQWENADVQETSYIIGKVLTRAIQKSNLSNFVKVMGI